MASCTQCLLINTELVIYGDFDCFVYRKNEVYNRKTFDPSYWEEVCTKEAEVVVEYIPNRVSNTDCFNNRNLNNYSWGEVDKTTFYWFQSANAKSRQ